MTLTLNLEISSLERNFDKFNFGNLKKSRPWVIQNENYVL